MSGKDSQEMIHFLKLFRELKDWIDDCPEELKLSKYSEDESIKNLCSNLSEAYETIQKSNDNAFPRYTGPVDPQYIEIQRDYECRYENAVNAVLEYSIFGQSLDEFFGSKTLGGKWELIDQSAKLTAEQIDSIIGENEFWQNMKKDSEIDLHGIFRRSKLIPFVQIPRHMANREAHTVSLPISPSLYENLKQAQKAFIFGALFATITVLRSVVEVVLRNHYDAKGGSLAEMIDDVGSRLPKEANQARLHFLRNLANDILHIGIKTNFRHLEDMIKLEKETLNLLFAVRALIEKTPSNRKM